jgi:hypothetical protein
MSNYFSNFPVINYPDAGLVKNIAARVRFDNIDNATLPYTMNHSLRPDQIADRYYNDQNDDWSIYIANNIIDPYYQWYLDPEVLDELVINEHGSLEFAAQKIVFWRTNWRSHGGQIAPAVYDALPGQAKQYFNANTDDQMRVVSYQRKKVNIYRATNVIVRYILASPLPLAVGDPVILGLAVGTGVVSAIDGLNVLVKDIIGQQAVTLLNGVACTIVEQYAPISLVEAPYFEPVSAYDAAVALNDSRRTIKVVAPAQIGSLNKELTRVLS